MMLKRILVLLVFASNLLLGQTFRDRSDTGFDLGSRVDRQPSMAVPSPAVAFEGTIDPQRYYVGPSDIISVNIWISPPLNLPLTVTPEGTLIIPMVGEVGVANMTLAEAKDQVTAAVRRKYISGDVTVTLLTPRPIVVTVTGHVLHPGLYTLSAVDRVTSAMEQANKARYREEQPRAEWLMSEMSTRNVVVRHRDGSYSRVDIPKFLATKEDRWNPYLREGDVIVVPRRNVTKNVIAVYGGVNAPGRFEYTSGDSIKDAILLAHGFTPRAIRDSIEFYRLARDGKQMMRQVIPGTALFSGTIPDLALEPGDRVVVREWIDQREDYRVTVWGEVSHPGTYPITKNRTRLSEVVRQAGGFTASAALKSAELIRTSVRPQDVELEQLLSLRGGVSFEDSLYYLVESELRIRKEIVNVDFDRLFNHGDTTQDVILMSEDQIVIPSLKHTVYVFGQVAVPGHVPYLAGANAAYYIRKAGGFTDQAREKDMRIIKASTRQWLSPKDTMIEDGDYVWIPKKIERPFIYYSTIVSHMAGILSAIVGVAIVISTVGK